MIELSPMMIIIAVAALLIGVVIGLLLGRGRTAQHETVSDLKQRLDQANTSRADYEAEVAEHFKQTAQLVNKMTQDYQAVYSHLASGANKLCEGQIDMPLSLAGPDDDDSDEIPADRVDVSQPLDYAPRSNDEQGQLSETFGLDRDDLPPSERKQSPEGS